MAYIGVINPLNPRVESPEEVRDALVRAANFIPKEQLGSTDDCGFSPFSIDEKPSHGSPDFARDTAFAEDHQPGRGDQASRGEARHQLTVSKRRDARTVSAGIPPLPAVLYTAVLSEQELADLPGPRRRRDVALMSRHDRALHEDMPFARERIGIADAGRGGELFDIAPDIGQMPDGSLVDRMLPVVNLDHRRQEGAALEVRLAEPLREHVEYRQQLLAGSFAAPTALSLQPLARP